MPRLKIIFDFWHFVFWRFNPVSFFSDLDSNIRGRGMLVHYILVIQTNSISEKCLLNKILFDLNNESRHYFLFKKLINSSTLYSNNYLDVSVCYLKRLWVRIHCNPECNSYQFKRKLSKITEQIKDRYHFYYLSFICESIQDTKILALNFFKCYLRYIILCSVNN